MICCFFFRLATFCSNCIGCFLYGQCFDYVANGSNGPSNVQSCESVGGIDCSGNLSLIQFITYLKPI